MGFWGNVHVYSSEPERSVTENLFQHPENPIPRVPNLKSQSRCQSWKTLAPPSGIHDPHTSVTGGASWGLTDPRSRLGPWSLTAAQELAASNGCPGDTDACAGSPRIPLQETLIWSHGPTCQLVTRRPPSMSGLGERVSRIPHLAPSQGLTTSLAPLPSHGARQDLKHLLWVWDR